MLLSFALKSRSPCRESVLKFVPAPSLLPGGLPQAEQYGERGRWRMHFSNRHSRLPTELLHLPGTLLKSLTARPRERNPFGRKYPATSRQLGFVFVSAPLFTPLSLSLRRLAPPPSSLPSTLVYAGPAMEKAMRELALIERICSGWGTG